MFHETTSTSHESHELHCAQSFNLLGRYAWEICSLLSGRRQFSYGSNWWYHFNFPGCWYQKYFVLLDKGSEGRGDLIHLEIPVPQVIWSYLKLGLHGGGYTAERYFSACMPHPHLVQPFTHSPADHIGTAAPLWHSGGQCSLFPSVEEREEGKCHSGPTLLLPRSWRRAPVQVATSTFCRDCNRRGDKCLPSGAAWCCFGLHSLLQNGAQGKVVLDSMCSFLFNISFDCLFPFFK